MSTTPINPRELASPRGYNNGMMAPSGRMLAIAGQIALGRRRARLVSTDFVAQFEPRARQRASPCCTRPAACPPI